jgi:hypothetical protein
MALKWYICQTPKCAEKGLKVKFEESLVTTQKCATCKKKGEEQWKEATAPKPVGYKAELDLTLVTVDQLMQVFVVDEHQVKHYRTGSGDYGLFEGMEWADVHKLICHGARTLLTAQKEAALDAPTDGFITITGLAENYWPAGKGKGRTNTLKIQMGTSGGTFSGHGYPVDDVAFRANASRFKLSIGNGAWRATQLSAANNSIRKK